VFTKLFVATTNPSKLKELKELLADLPFALLSLSDFPNAVEVEEDGATFRENAEKKALGYAKQTGCLTLAEDSGLAVDYLDGKPGVHSARFSGPEKDDLENCRKVLTSLEGVSREGRTAAFKCACALASPKKVISVVEESVTGQITEKMWGKGGFGYDPLFFYPDFGTTFANVTAARKHSVSHRGKALRKMKEVLKEYLQEGKISSGC
jgi:XTP/dITP diphosphohydrolase